MYTRFVKREAHNRLGSVEGSRRWGGNEIWRNSKSVTQSEGFGICDGLSVRAKRAVYSGFRIVLRQFYCMSRGVHMLSRTYR